MEKKKKKDITHRKSGAKMVPQGSCFEKRLLFSKRNHFPLKKRSETVPLLQRGAVFPTKKGWKWCLFAKRSRFSYKKRLETVPLLKEEPFSKKRLEMVPLFKKRHYFGSSEAPFFQQKKVKNGPSFKKGAPF